MSWPPELVALRINRGLADEKMGSDLAFAREQVHRMGDDVDAVIAELRELAAGVYPSMLAGGGLSAALRSAAQRSQVEEFDSSIDRAVLSAAERAVTWRES